MSSVPEIRNFIGGAYAHGSGATFENRSPVDDRLLGLVHEAGQTEVAAAVEAARAALTGEWGRLTLQQRASMLHDVAAALERRFEDFLEAEVADTGKPVSLARRLDIPRGAANFRVFADLVKNAPTESFMLDTPDGGKALNYALRTPKGVIGVICPWNLPLLLMTWKVAPALACGNTVVVKPSEITPTTAALLGEVMNEAGIPAGVYNVVQGFGAGSAGEHLVSHLGIDAITFTGETVTGEAIMRSAAAGVRPVSLELGGKNPAIIFEDADFDRAVASVVQSCFMNTGQVCLGTERVYVQRALFPRFVAALKEKAEALRPGDPKDPATTLGPLSSKEHQAKVLGYYHAAAAAGATIVTGGGIPAMHGGHAAGAWGEPTIWTDLPEDSPIVREEIFGPCCHIRPFDTEDEVVALANATPFGLAASVWTNDLTRGHRVAARLEVGVCWVNAWFLRDLRTAFGGAKQSGIGREGGVHSLEFYTELRNVCVQL